MGIKILAIDQGTTSTRGLVVNAQGQTEVVFARPHEQIYPKSGWVEHDPLEIYQNILAAIDSADGVDAIGIANQGESCLAWNKKTLEPLSPILVWQDIRNAHFLQTHSALGETVAKRAHLPFDSYFSASKLQWIMKNIPEVKKAYANNELALGTTDAWFLAKLTGHAQTDASTASRTSLMNFKTLQWDEELCRGFEVPIETLPPICASVHKFGEATTATAKVPILASIVDQQAALYGHNCTTKGASKFTFGTGAFALCYTGSEPPPFQANAPIPTLAWMVDNRVSYALDGGIFAASAALNWAKNLGLFKDYESINAFSGKSAAERGIIFVPALFGLACPYWDREASGAWFGLKGETDAATMVQSILEGVAFRAAEVIDSIGQQIKIDAPIKIDGGLVNNAYFIQYLADLLELDLFVPDEIEQTAIGVAKMAALAMDEDITIFEAGTYYSPQKERKSERARFTHAREFVQEYRKLEKFD